MTHQHSLHLVVAAALFVAAGLLNTGRAATAVDVPAGAIKSVFNDQSGGGKDPFFPNSKRLLPKPVVSTGGTQLKPDWLVLNGFSAAPNGKLAMINGRTFAIGEESTLKHGAQSMKVKCIDIKDDSVVVEVNGSTKELKLRTGL